MSGEGAIGYTLVAVTGGTFWMAELGVQAAALVAARAVDVLGAGLMVVGDRAERGFQEWQTGHAAQLRWETGSRRVIDLNARITVLRQHLPADLATGLPAPLAPSTQSAAELDAWCTAVGAAVGQVEAAWRGRTEKATLSVLRHGADTERPVSAAEAFDRYHRALAAQAQQKAAVPPRALDAVSRILSRLPVDVSDEDRADALAAAAQASALRSDLRTDDLLDELRLRVQRAGERTELRRADAIRAATTLQALPDGIDDAELRVDLAEVIAGRRALDPALRGRADRAAQKARAGLERDYVRASVTNTLSELGYEVDQGFATVTGNPDRMRLVRPDWSGHAVQVALDGDEMRAAVVRLEDRSGVDARREDTEREEQWCEHLERLRESLDGSGLRVVARRLVPPGERIPAVVKRRRGGGDGHAARERQR